MPDDSNTINTGGGSNIQGNANAGNDFVGRDKIYNNFYNAPQPSAHPSISKEELDALYRQATTSHVQGDLHQAKELFEQVRSFSPTYPGVSRSLRMIKSELGKPYVGIDGRVIKERIHLDATTSSGCISFIVSLVIKIVLTAILVAALFYPLYIMFEIPLWILVIVFTILIASTIRSSVIR